MAASPSLEKSHNNHPDSESDGEAEVKKWVDLRGKANTLPHLQ